MLKPFSKIVLSNETAEDIAVLAAEAAPREFFSFVGGKVRDGVLRLDGLYYQQYYASEQFATVFHNLPMLNDCQATVHSHPGIARPSAADLHTFGKHGLVHFIIAKPYRIVDLRCFDKQGVPLAFSIERPLRKAY